MHFKNHQEYLRFFRQTPVEPKEYIPGKVTEPEAPAETQEEEQEKPKRRRRKDG